MVDSGRKVHVLVTKQGGPKNWHTFLYALNSYALTSSIHVDQFSHLFHCLNQENICDKLNTVTIDPTTPQVGLCVATLPSEMSV